MTAVHIRDRIDLPPRMGFNDTGKEVIVGRLIDVLLGRKPEPEIRECHIVVTIFYLSLTLLFCRLLRLANEKILHTKLQPFIGDFISAFQSIACGLENSFVRTAYGMGVYCLQTLLLGYWSSKTFGRSCGNPLGNLRKYIEGKHRKRRTMTLISLQMIGGMTAYQYAKFVWHLGLSSEHTSRHAQGDICISHLQVPVAIGLFIELTATVIDVIIAKSTTKKFKFEHYEPFAKGIFGFGMTVGGLHLTGMYLNPTNAFVQTFHCSGNTVPEYMLVYWLGPVTGCAIGVVIHNQLSKLLHGIQKGLHNQHNINGDTHLMSHESNTQLNELMTPDGNTQLMTPESQPEVIGTCDIATNEPCDPCDNIANSEEDKKNL